MIVINEQEKEEVMRSIAQKYRDEGIEIGTYKGMEIGIEKGIGKVTQNMLCNLHLDLDIVQKATGLTQKDLEQILRGEEI